MNWLCMQGRTESFFWEGARFKVVGGGHKERGEGGEIPPARLSDAYVAGTIQSGLIRSTCSFCYLLV